MNRKIINISLIISFLAVCGLIFTLNSSCSKGNKKIQIGAILPMTGKMAIIGEPERIGIELAVEGLSSTNSSPSIQVHYKDSQGSPKIAVTLVRELISKYSIEALIVSTSPCVLAVKPIAEEANIPLFAITSLPDVGDGKVVFRISPNSVDETRSIIEYFKKSKLQQLALIYPNNELGLKIKQAAEESSKPDITLSLVTEYTVGEQDFRTLIVRLKNLKLDAVCFAGYPFDIPIFARQLKESGLTIRLLTSMASVWPSTTKGLIDIGASPIFPSPAFGIPALRSNEAQDFANRYKAKTSSDANYDAAFVYDTVMVLNRLLNSKEAEQSLESRWASLGSIDGVSGPIQFLRNGETSIQLYMATISNNNVVSIDKK